VRVLVLGGAGFIGCHITQQLFSHGHEVAVFGRRSTIADLPGDIQVIPGDRNLLEASARELSTLHPDVVVDAIAFTEDQARALVAVFRGIAQRIVVLSSGDVYRAYDVLFRRIQGAIEPTPLSELSALRDRLYPYRGVPLASSEGFNWDHYEKIVVEGVVMSCAELPATVLRLPMVYGPGDYRGQKRRFWAYLKRMDDGRPAIPLDQRMARWRAPWGYVEDVAEAVRFAVENDSAAGKVYNVGEADGLDIQGWVEELGLVAGWRGRIVLVDEHGHGQDPS
jgi:nucleoside-diphosphate-sugar epimerase